MMDRVACKSHNKTRLYCVKSGSLSTTPANDTHLHERPADSEHLSNISGCIFSQYFNAESQHLKCGYWKLYSFILFSLFKLRAALSIQHYSLLIFLSNLCVCLLCLLPKYFLIPWMNCNETFRIYSWLAFRVNPIQVGHYNWSRH